MLASNLIYAIGDINGRLDLLTALLDFVAAQNPPGPSCAVASK
jgi:hypothetical protein